MRAFVKQLKLNIYRGNHGGRRPGAGRRRKHSKGVAHAARETITRRTPLHINFKLKAALRSKFALGCLRRAIQRARLQGLKVLQFSLQSNHVHLIVEAENNATLTRSMRALTISFAKGLGQGRVQLERYHLHVLRSLREVRHALLYVLFNGKKHSGGKVERADAYSSLSKVSALGQLARLAGHVIVLKRITDLEVERPSSWLARRASRELFLLRPATT